MHNESTEDMYDVSDDEEDEGISSTMKQKIYNYNFSTNLFQSLVQLTVEEVFDDERIEGDVRDTNTFA
jgi:hypothetical protein